MSEGERDLLREAITSGLASFAADPADTPYQEGYRDALLALQDLMQGNPKDPLA